MQCNLAVSMSLVETDIVIRNCLAEKNKTEVKHRRIENNQRTAVTHFLNITCRNLEDRNHQKKEN
jgi:hypothetical protein